MEQDQEFLEYVIRGIVNNPDVVKSERIVDERGVLLTLDVDPSDMGYVIGRQGQTARAVRTLLKIVGAKNNARVNLKINEPAGGYHRPSAPAMASTQSVSTMSTATTDDVDMSAVDDLNI